MFSSRKAQRVRPTRANALRCRLGGTMLNPRLAENFFEDYMVSFAKQGF